MILVSTDFGQIFNVDADVNCNLIERQIIKGLEVWLWIEDEVLYLSVDNRQVLEIEVFDGDTYHINISKHINNIKEYYNNNGYVTRDKRKLIKH